MLTSNGVSSLPITNSLNVMGLMVISGVLITLSSSLMSTLMATGRLGSSKLRLVPGMSIVVALVSPSRVKWAMSGIPPPPSPRSPNGSTFRLLISPVRGSLRIPPPPTVIGIWGMVMV
ncbi:hypothetical protein DAVIS_04867 [Mycobacterium marinum]|uniref:Uncharacterized protein n=1 Tax=Mycobacterium marinum TaxID=1781 RepID=A0A3E2MPM1_MYCMR|nr:hypothetical protein DAVIS_04867 [Mycobacterium marinum]